MSCTSVSMDRDSTSSTRCVLNNPINSYSSWEWGVLSSWTHYYINCIRSLSFFRPHYGSMQVECCHNSNIPNLESLTPRAPCDSSTQWCCFSTYPLYGTILSKKQSRDESLSLTSLECVCSAPVDCRWYSDHSFWNVAYSPSKIQICTLDLFIIALQLLLTTIAYETSVYYDNDDADPQDLLLPGLATPLPLPLFQSPIESSPSLTHPKAISTFDTHDTPLVIDLHFDSIMTHLRQPPPPPRTTNPDRVSVPNTTQWVPGMWMRTTRRIRDAARTAGRPPIVPGGRVSREGRIPGALNSGSEWHTRMDCVHSILIIINLKVIDIGRIDHPPSSYCTVYPFSRWTYNIASFIVIFSSRKRVNLGGINRAPNNSLTDSRTQDLKRLNSSLQISFVTSVYVAMMHFAYAVAWAEQVVVAWNASRFIGRIGCFAAWAVEETIASRSCIGILCFKGKIFKETSKVLRTGKWLRYKRPYG